MSDTQFLLYVGALVVAGLILLITAAVGFGSTTGARVVNAVLGVIALGYAFYLYFIFDGGTVFISFYALVLPILAIVNLFKNRKTKQVQQEQQAVPPAGPTLPTQ